MKAISSLTLVLFCSIAVAQIDAPPLVAPPEAVRMENGLAMMVIKEPAGTAMPVADDFVTLEYTGWNASGVVIDSTTKHPDVRTFAFAKLFPGLQQTIAMMRVGEKRRVWIPESLTIKKAPLVFDVELLDITRPLATPEDVAATPADAERSKSGLAWKILKPADGTSTHPKRNSYVVVHYSGLTTDGTMFDSSYGRGEPTSFKLDEVIPGWIEGLQLMTAGEKRRFWIPSKLAYRGQRGMPKGMLVFDVELIRFR